MIQPIAAEKAVEHFGIQPGTLRQWVRRNKISPPVDGFYDAAELLAWHDTRSHRHALAARHQRHTTRRDSCGTRRDV